MFTEVTEDGRNYLREGSRDCSAHADYLLTSGMNLSAYRDDLVDMN